MSGSRHRPNAELLAHGVANMGAAMFGGICVIRAARPRQGITHQPPWQGMICHLHGPYLPGAAARPGAFLDQIASHSSALVVNFSDVPFIDSTGARSFELLARKPHRKGTQLILAGVNAEVRKTMERSGLNEPLVRYCPDFQTAEVR